MCDCCQMCECMYMKKRGVEKENMLIDWCRLLVWERWLETRVMEQLPPVARQQQDPSLTPHPDIRTTTHLISPLHSLLEGVYAAPFCFMINTLVWTVQHVHIYDQHTTFVTCTNSHSLHGTSQQGLAAQSNCDFTDVNWNFKMWSIKQVCCACL